LHATLNVPSEALRSYFYFRVPEYAFKRGGDFICKSAEDSQRQRILKSRIEEECRKHNLSLRKGYDNPRQLAQWVLEDLTAAIKEDFPVDQTVDSSLSEQEAFAATRRRVYRHSEASYARLDAYARSTSGTLVITGAAGFGKTALLANWSQIWRAANPDDFVFEHFTASSPDSADHWSLMLRLVRQIKTWSRDDSPVPDSNERLSAEFEIWLHKLRGEAARRSVRAIVIMDGLDQLDNEHHAKLLQWLPESPWKGPLRLIASTRTPPEGEHDPLTAMTDRGCERLEVDSLGYSDRRDLIVEYLGRFRKTLLPQELDVLSAVEAGQNPLFLKILLDELVVTGQYGQTMTSLLAGYAQAKNVPELLDKVLVRWQDSYERDRPNLVAEALSLIYSARRGLREDELLRCLRADGQTALPFAVWSPLRYALWEGLANRRDILNFGHEYLRKAVEHRFMKEGKLAEEYRKRLANEFNLSQPTSRSCEEFPWLLLQTGQFERLREFLLGREPFLILTGGRNSDLFMYWQQLDRPDRVGAKYEAAFDRWNLAASHKDDRQRSLDAFDLARFVDSFGAPASAERLIKISLDAIERYSGSDAPELAQVYRTQARLLKEARRFSEAATSLHKALVINEKWYTEDDPVISENLVSIAQLLDVMMQYDQALEFATRASRSYERKGDLRALGRALVSIGSINMNAGRLNEASEALEQAQAVGHVREFGPSEALGMYFSYRGQIFAARKHFTEAIKNFSESAETLRTLYGNSNFAVLRQTNNLATILMEQGQLEEGLRVLRACVGTITEITDKTNSEYGIACSNLSCALSGAGEYAESVIYSERAVSSLAPFGSQGRGSVEYAAVLNHHGLALLKNGRPSEAIDAWKTAVARMIVSAKIGAASSEEALVLMSNAVRGLTACGLNGKSVYELLAPQFEAEQVLDMQLDLARQMGGQTDPNRFPVSFLSQTAVDLMPWSILTEHQRLRKELAKQIEFHLGRVEAAPVVPLTLCRQIRRITDSCLDTVAFRALHMDSVATPNIHFRYSEANNEVLFLVSVFNCNDDEVQRFFVNHSNEEGFGYVSYILRWINNWPSPRLSMIFHLIINRRGGGRMYHTCFWDNTNGANGPKEFAVLPIELLTPIERRSVAAGSSESRDPAPTTDIRLGIFFFNSDDGRISGNYALHAKMALRERVAERYPRVMDPGWHVLSGDLFGPRNIQIILTTSGVLSDAARVDSTLRRAFAEGNMPAFVPYLIGLFMCPLDVLQHADDRLKADNVAGYLGLTTMMLPNEKALREIAEALSLPMTEFNSV